MQFVVFEKIYECLFIPNCTRKITWLPVNNIHEKISPCWLKISRWLTRKNARVSRSQGKFAPWIAPSRACAWFENKRFDWPSVSFSFATFLSVNLISRFCTQFSTFCTNFVFLHSKNFKFLHCLGLIDMLSANQHGEIFLCILLGLLMRDIYETGNYVTFGFFTLWSLDNFRSGVNLVRSVYVFCLRKEIIKPTVSRDRYLTVAASEHHLSSTTPSWGKTKDPGNEVGRMYCQENRHVLCVTLFM